MNEEDRADAFRGLANPIRRKVLTLLKKKPRTVTELLELLDEPITQPGMSRHMSILRACGLVKQSKHGASRVYEVNRSGIQRVSKWLKQVG